MLPCVGRASTSLDDACVGSSNDSMPMDDESLVQRPVPLRCVSFISAAQCVLYHRVTFSLHAWQMTLVHWLTKEPSFWALKSN